MKFTQARRTQRQLRFALIGPPGSGKTMSSLKIARGLVGPAGRIALIDTENHSASLYADTVDFDTLALTSFAPDQYVKAIHAAEDAGYDALVIDSLSHAWSGKDGALEQVDKRSARDPRGNSFTAWREVTPQHNTMVDALVRSRMHLLVTMRVKVDYVMEKNERTGKMEPRKVGLAPVQREGLEYEFDVVADMSDATLCVTKTRCSALHGATITRPDERVGRDLIQWLNAGDAPDAPGSPPLQATQPPAAAQLPAPSPAPKGAPATKPAAGDAVTVRILDVTARSGQTAGSPWTCHKIVTADANGQELAFYTTRQTIAEPARAIVGKEWAEIEYVLNVASGRRDAKAVRPVQLREGDPSGQRIVAADAPLVVNGVVIPEEEISF